ncbi:MAG: zinc ribbon domain-containing protein [bacterium]
MPIREYRCVECGLEFESLQIGGASPRQDDATDCPACGSVNVARKMSLFSSLKSETSSCSTRPTTSGFG